MIAQAASLETGDLKICEQFDNRFLARNRQRTQRFGIAVHDFSPALGRGFALVLPVALWPVA